MTRRQWLQRAGWLAAGLGCGSSMRSWSADGRRLGDGQDFNGPRQPSSGGKCAFRLSVITDEIGQDFGHTLEVAAREFGLGWVEVRSLWNKNIVNLDAAEFTEARRLLDKYDLKVTDIASPLFKVDWPGAPKSKYAPADAHGDAGFSFAQQDEVLERAIDAGRRLGTNRVRCFDFWRLDDPKPYRDAIDERLRIVAEKAGKQNFSLLLENEFACNTATGVEAARTMNAVQSPNLLLNWDPGNAAYRGEVAYPDGYAPIPKQRIGHMHLKDVQQKPEGSYDWQAMGRGLIDYAGQFRALLKDGYSGTMSLETHWGGAGSAEESTRQSLAGTKVLLRKVGALTE